MDNCLKISTWNSRITRINRLLSVIRVVVSISLSWIYALNLQTKCHTFHIIILYSMRCYAFIFLVNVFRCIRRLFLFTFLHRLMRFHVEPSRVSLVLPIHRLNNYSKHLWLLPSFRKSNVLYILNTVCHLLYID